MLLLGRRSHGPTLIVTAVMMYVIIYLVILLVLLTLRSTLYRAQIVHVNVVVVRVHYAAAVMSANENPDNDAEENWQTPREETQRSRSEMVF